MSLTTVSSAAGWDSCASRLSISCPIASAIASKSLAFSSAAVAAFAASPESSSVKFVEREGSCPTVPASPACSAGCVERSCACSCAGRVAFTIARMASLGAMPAVFNALASFSYFLFSPSRTSATAFAEYPAKFLSMATSASISALFSS